MAEKMKLISDKKLMVAYLNALKEIHRILKKSGILGLGEPMHYDKLIPDDLSTFIKKF